MAVLNYNFHWQSMIIYRLSFVLMKEIARVVKRVEVKYLTLKPVQTPNDCMSLFYCVKALLAEWYGVT